MIILGASGREIDLGSTVLGGMDTNDDGHVFVDGVTFRFLMKQLTYYRRDDVGRSTNLVPNLTAKENVELAAEIAKRRSRCRGSLEGSRTWTIASIIFQR